MPREYRRYEPNQTLLLPPSLRDWLPEDHFGLSCEEVESKDETALRKKL